MVRCSAAVDVLVAHSAFALLMIGFEGLHTAVEADVLSPRASCPCRPLPLRAPRRLSVSARQLLTPTSPLSPSLSPRAVQDQQHQHP